MKSRRNLNLVDWPVARRLFTVIVAALVMGLVFGGLRVADAENSANQFSKTLQLAKLSQQLIGVSRDLENEEDATVIALVTNNPGNLDAVQRQTDNALVPVTASLNQVLNGGFNATIESDAKTVSNDLAAGNLGAPYSPSATGDVTSTVHELFDTQPASGGSTIPEYETIIGDIATLQGQVSLGITDPTLDNDVQTLGALGQVNDLTSQERTTLDQALAGDGALGSGSVPFASENSLNLFSTQVLTDQNTFNLSATQSQLSEFDSLLGPTPAALDGETESNTILTALLSAANTNGTPLDSFIDTTLNGTPQTPGYLDLSGSIAQNDINANGAPATGEAQAAAAAAAVQRAGAIADNDIPQLMTRWDTGIDAELHGLQQTEQLVAADAVSRATQLQQGAQQSALLFLIITIAVLVVVLGGALLVARSVVLPLRQLRAGALDIASVQLPERVRLLSDNPESAASMEVAPINVTSLDEIGQVARAFDQVHSEAVRLAGEQALLRSSFNAMFVNLSRRSQTLIERLARMIDNLEQNEDDPERLGSLFSMDHLVTRMRRNSENLLLLAGHENPRKWSESVPIPDIARAATSEIEQYNRVTLNIPPGISVIGQAVSDVVHLLAELIENATIFSPKDTHVQVSMQELTSGGVLIEIVDKGIGVSDARLTDMNWRLDNPPTIDVSVSRHMGLFAVARLAERHRVRVRLRPAPPQGLSALVWLPDSVIERTNKLGGAAGNWSAQPVGARARVGAGDSAALTTGGGGSVGLATDYADYATDYRSGNDNSVVGYSRGSASNAHGNGSDSGNGNGSGSAEGRTAKGWFRGGQDSVQPPGGGLGGGLGRTLGGKNGDFFSEPSVASDQTAAGLPVRVPRANLPPGTGTPSPASPLSAPESPGSGLPPRSVGASGRTAGSVPGNANGGSALPKRSADQARSRLSGFQRGTRRAERQGGTGGQTPRAGEGTDR